MGLSVVILLSTEDSGTTLKQFLQIKQVCQTVFSKVDFATKDGLPPLFDQKTDIQLDTIDYKKIDLLQNDYHGLVVPDGLGFYSDESKELGDLIWSFVKFKSN
jgi:hypothetical protein